MADNRDRRDRRDSADATEAQLRDEEIRRMVAFRLREAANRIAALAHSTEHEPLRTELIAVCERILQEERTVLAATPRR